MHFGVILPNYGLDSNPDGIRRTVELAEELGFDSVWATEHIIVGPEAVDPYEAGAEGAVVSFADEAAMHDFARRYQ